jgi:hypothetical protein
MISSNYVLSGTIFLTLTSIVQETICYVVGTSKNDDSPAARTSRLKAVLAALVGMYACKYAYEQNMISGFERDVQFNHYDNLGVGRHARPMQIIATFKKLRSELDVNRLTSSEAQERYEEVKYSYDLLLDESTRNVYNLFGPGYEGEDPRNNELSLVSGLAAVYLFFLFCTMMTTTNRAAKASRIWIMIVIVAVLIFDVLLRIVPDVIEIPKCFPASMTEHELMLQCYSILPLIIAVLRAVAEWLYVDTHLSTIRALEHAVEQKRGLTSLLKHFHSVVSKAGEPGLGKVGAAKVLVGAQSLTRGVAQRMEESVDSMDDCVETLRNSSSNSNPFASYYWIIFVVIYGLIYLFQ